MPGLLPTELYVEIIYWVLESEKLESSPHNLPTMRRCALVCATFAALVRPTLFSLLELEIKDDSLSARPSFESVLSSHPPGSGLEPPWCLVESVEISFDVVESVRDLTAIRSDTISQMGHLLSMIYNHSHSFSFLSCKSRLTFDLAAACGSAEAYKHLVTSLVQLCLSTTLKSLIFDSISSIPIQCIQNISIRRLELRYVDIMMDQQLLHGLSISDSSADFRLILGAQALGPFPIETLQLHKFRICDAIHSEDKTTSRSDFCRFLQAMSPASSQVNQDEVGLDDDETAAGHPAFPQLVTLTQTSSLSNNAAVGYQSILKHCPNLLYIRLYVFHVSDETRSTPPPNLSHLTQLRHFKVMLRSTRGATTPAGLEKTVRWIQRALALTPPSLTRFYLCLKFQLHDPCMTSATAENTTSPPWISAGTGTNAAWKALVDEVIARRGLQEVHMEVGLQHQYRRRLAVDAVSEDTLSLMRKRWMDWSGRCHEGIGRIFGLVAEKKRFTYVGRIR